MRNIKIARDVIDTEIQALEFLKVNLDENFDKVVAEISQSSARVVVSGMGKSGIIGRKISASLSSTGTPSFFMHPADAFHGDLGMVRPGDYFIAISYSGETEEVLKLIPFLRAKKNRIIAITGTKSSTLSKSSDFLLNVAVPKEACLLQLAPTASTTATLAMGDALVVALMQSKSFTPDDFAQFHPGGSLGRKLLSLVKDEMQPLPSTHLNASSTFSDIISAITSDMQGFAIVKDSAESDIAIITDGDLRRAMVKYGQTAFNCTANMIASFNPYSVESTAKTEFAYNLMNEKRVNFLLVKDGSSYVGVIRR